MDTKNGLEEMAADLAAETGRSLPECRAALFVEAARVSVALGHETAEAANARLAELGVRIVDA